MLWNDKFVLNFNTKVFDVKDQSITEEMERE